MFCSQKRELLTDIPNLSKKDKNKNDFYCVLVYFENELKKNIGEHGEQFTVLFILQFASYL